MSEKKLSIALLSPGWPLSQYPNGIVTYVQNIISGFSNLANVHIIAREVKNEINKQVINQADFVSTEGLIDKLINKILFKFKISYAQDKLNERKWTSNVRQIKRALDSSGTSIDLIEVEESFGLARWLLAEINLPVITRLHGPWFIHGPIMKLDNDHGYEMRVKLEGQAIQASHGITAPSYDVLNRVREYYGFPLHDAAVIPNPVPEVPVDLQWKYQPGATPTVLIVSRFDLHKGGDLAIESFRIIAQHDKEVELRFVGPDRGVEIEDKVYSFSQYIDEFVPETHIKKRIHFIGHCDSKTIAELRRNSTVTMMTSRYDNFPMSLLESVACGSPVVGTAVGGIKEIIIDDYNGLLAIANSPESIAEKVIELLGDSQKMQALSKNAIQDSKARFSPKIVAKQTLEFYYSVLSKS